MAEVISVDNNGQPTAVRLDFNISLDDPALRWQKWKWKKSGFGSYSKFEIPAIGEKTYVEGPF